MKYFKPLLLTLSLVLPAQPVMAQPSHFSTTIGHSVLCLNVIDPGYIYNYMKEHFGNPHKREGGAWWFKVNAKLWGAPVTEVFVSDATSQYNFVGAVSSLNPQKLSESLLQTSRTGVRFHSQRPNTPYSPLRSRTGSEIVYLQNKAKIFCNGVDPHRAGRPTPQPPGPRIEARTRLQQGAPANAALRTNTPRVPDIANTQRLIR